MKACLTAAIALSLSVLPASAATLFEQLTGPGASSVVNQEFADLPTYSSYIVDDVTFATDVVIQSMTSFFSSEAPESSGMAVLNIFDGDTLTAADDPSGGGDFGISSTPVTYAVRTDANATDVTASGLSIALSAGTYWIGLTPIEEYGTFGQIFLRDAGANGNGTPAAFRNPGGGFGGGTDWTTPSAIGQRLGNAAFRIEGTAVMSAIPLPSSLLLLASGVIGAGVYGRRRGRKARLS
ncbi:VPLPA-CTERM protein sorting domain-containing protein [Jannaschia seohaensis]|uniref:Putative secreted protein n=2 Tax=Jannaschia seohaensis TaxID=475081 RepID=A0A2Y9B025_9RHOB|nr:putative secreted protein [Jannaschia seohaensis]SSA49854.1 VPLPA-CTERM protein sorting domain-containing protein [Jannaschia seohaensis]